MNWYDYLTVVAFVVVMGADLLRPAANHRIDRPALAEQLYETKETP